MKMAKDVFKQLDVISRRALLDQEIYDCYRLLYKEELWFTVWQSFTEDNQTKHARFDVKTFITKCIRQLQTNTFYLFPHLSCVKQKQLKLQDFRLKMIFTILQIIFVKLFPEVSNIEQYKKRNWQTLHHEITKFHHWHDATWIYHLHLEPNGMQAKLLSRILASRLKDRRMIRLIIQSFQLLQKLKVTSFDPLFNNHVYSRYLLMLTTIYVQPFNTWIKHLSYNYNEQIPVVQQFHTWVFALQGNKEIAQMWCKRMESYVTSQLAIPKQNIKSDLREAKRPFYFAHYQVKMKNNRTRRQFLIPNSVCIKYASRKKYGNLVTFTSNHRTNIKNYSVAKIIHIYTRELKQLAYYYALADNFHHLRKLYDLAKSSLLKTLAYKQRTTTKQIVKKLHRKQLVSANCKALQTKKQANYFIPFRELKQRNVKERKNCNY